MARIRLEMTRLHTHTLKKIWDIAFLSRHERGPHMSNADTSRYLRIGESTVRNWLERYETTGNVEVEQKSGRKQSTTQKQDAIIQSVVAQYPTESVNQIAFKLSKKGIKISQTKFQTIGNKWQYEKRLA
ncbi:hypothetical protein I4U23_022585 [Adineta vaga]|nr:hypothetical protein I4U23_022585 [Adineta vaga]